MKRSVDVHTYRERILRELHVAIATAQSLVNEWIDCDGEGHGESLDELRGQRNALQEIYRKIKAIPTRDLRGHE
jgi:hypothetical protein